MTATIHLSYEQQKKSTEMFAFSHSHLIQYPIISGGMEKYPVSRSNSDSSTSSIHSSTSISSSSSIGDDISDSEEEDEGSRKQNIRQYFEDRDRHFEVQHLLKRKSLRLCRQRSYPVSETQEMQWSNAGGGSATLSSRRNSCSRRDSLKADQTLLLPRSLTQIAKGLRENCDKILDKTIPFVIDSYVLWKISEAINELTTNRVTPPPQDTNQDYEDHVLFLSDFFEQTPSLVISLSEISPISPGSLDLTLFRSLEFLELRKISPHYVSGLNTLRSKLKRFKCSRNIDSLDQIFNVPFCAEILSSPENKLNPVASSALTSIWPELREIDASFNRITHVDSISLECTPVLEILNLSRNRISTFEPNYNRLLHNLTVLNLNFNQLTGMPPTPPNLKILLISNNYISSFQSTTPLSNNLEVIDLSHNVISNENDLEPLRNLTLLRNLFLNGNPLTYSGKYRKTVAMHLPRVVLQNKSFTLDSKRLSASEIRVALETKRPSPVINPPAFLLTRTKSGNAQNRMMDLTQSIDSSSSSSVRSACRKKAKIREIVSFDTPTSENDKIEIPKTTRTTNRMKSRLSRSSSSSSSIEEVPVPSDEKILATGEALKSMSEKYGEFWLFRQAGQDVSNLLNMDSTKISGGSTGSSTATGDNSPKKSLSLSQSFPLNMKDSSYFTALSELELSNVTLAAAPMSEHITDSSDDSIRHVENPNECSSSDGLVFYPCHSNSSSESPDDSNRLDIFKDPNGQAEYFKTYENGITHQIIILDNFLYEIDEKENKIQNKWDLKSLKSLRELSRNSETEAVNFLLSFDTLRKQFREKKLIMTLPDFKSFQERVNLYLQESTLREFGNGFQCTKCQWFFSKGMAGKTVIIDKENQPKEIPVCPNSSCLSELLIPFDNVEISSSPTTKGSWEPPQGSSTPIPGLGKSLPLDLSTLREPPPKSSNSSIIGSPKSNIVNNEFLVPPPPSTKKDAKSESSDIESCDSSSIEVLPKTTSNSGNDSGSDVAVVEEGIEVEMPEFQAGAMIESKSSTGSICTQYEKTLTNPISSLLSPFSSSIMQHSSSSGSLTPTTSINQPISQPFKYDFIDFNKVDHRLVLYIHLNLFKCEDERLLGLAKVMVMTNNGTFLCIVTFTNKKIYFCKIVGIEGDKVESWLQNWKSFPLSKLSKVDVLIGHHGLGLDFSAGKYFALIFKDSNRTNRFVDFFLAEVFGEIEEPPMVQDLGQTQNVIVSSENPILYFGILRHAYCGNGQGTDKSYAVSAVVVTNKELILVADLSWLLNRGSESVTVKHARELTKLRQIESLESDSFIRLIYDLDSVMLKWELAFETESERKEFIKVIRAEAKDVPYIILSQPRLP